MPSHVESNYGQTKLLNPVCYRGDVFWLADEHTRLCAFLRRDTRASFMLSFSPPKIATLRP